MFATDMLYLEEGKRDALPEWGKFFVSAGFSLASRVEEGSRGTLGVAAPTRARAAVLAALGVVAARKDIPVIAQNPCEHVEMLRQLPLGSAVRLYQGGRKLKGLFQGFRTNGGMEQIGVQIENRRSGGLEHWLPITRATDIEVSETQIEKLPDRQKGQGLASREEIVRQNRLVEVALAPGDVYEFAEYSRLECVIVGIASELREEIMGMTLSAQSPSPSEDFVDGNMQHLLRVRELCGSGQSYRSSVVPATGQSRPSEWTDTLAPAVVIFDGATSFLKWRNEWRNSHRLLLLDRTERHFEEGVTTLNQEYLQNRANDRKVPLDRQAPPGLELTSFRESRR